VTELENPGAAQENLFGRVHDIHSMPGRDFRIENGIESGQHL